MFVRMFLLLFNDLTLSSNCYTQTDIEASKKGVLFVSGFTTLEAISTSAEWDWFKNRVGGGYFYTGCCISSFD